MSLINFVTANQATNQGKGCVYNKHPQQDQPGPEQLRCNPGSLNRDDTEHHADESASSVSHEDACRGKIPEQKSSNRHRQQSRNPHLAFESIQPIKQASTQARRNRFNTGYTIDSVHEIVKIEHPDKIDRRQDASQPTKIHSPSKQGNRRQPPQTEQGPGGRTEMA
ncbi:hypothetical protein D3C73_1258770 [compost metagenome]